MHAETLPFRLSWLALLVTSLATLGFGVVVVLIPGSDQPYLGSIGTAAIGMGLFGSVVTVTAFRRRERWAYLALWYYPVFWTAHLVGNLPPGRDHVHQVLFAVLSLGALLVAARQFFATRPSSTS